MESATIFQYPINIHMSENIYAFNIWTKMFYWNSGNWKTLTCIFHISLELVTIWKTVICNACVTSHRTIVVSNKLFRFNNGNLCFFKVSKDDLIHFCNATTQLGNFSRIFKVDTCQSGDDILHVRFVQLLNIVCCYCLMDFLFIFVRAYNKKNITRRLEDMNMSC